LNILKKYIKQFEKIKCVKRVMENKMIQGKLYSISEGSQTKKSHDNYEKQFNNFNIQEQNI
jgi:hypothetical protein